MGEACALQRFAPSNAMIRKQHHDPDDGESGPKRYNEECLSGKHPPEAGWPTKAIWVASNPVHGMTSVTMWHSTKRLTRHSTQALTSKVRIRRIVMLISNAHQLPLRTTMADFLFSPGKLVPATRCRRQSLFI